MNTNEIQQLSKTKSKFFYGYVIVIAAFVILLVSPGIHNAFGIFLNPLLTEFGWSRGMTSGAFSLSMIVYGVLGIAMGGLTDRFSPRLVVTICGILLGLGYFLISQLHSLWQLYLFLGVIVGIGMSGVWIPQMSTIARWFVKRRSMMTGIVVAGLGISQLITPPIVSRLVAAYDWRLSYAILGGAVLIVMVIAAQFLKHDPAQMGQLPYSENKGRKQELRPETQSYSFQKAISTPQFWMAFMILFCSGFGYTAIMIHIVPHAIDLKISALSAANILATMGGTSIIGNYVLGGAADRIGNRKVFISGFILVALTEFWLVSAGEQWMLYLIAVVFGFAIGGLSTVESPLVASVFGLSSHGLIYGVIHVGFTIGAAIGPFITGYIFDLTASYQIAFVVCIVVAVVGFILAVFLRSTKELHARL